MGFAHGNHHTGKYGGHRQCGSGDMLREDSKCSRFKPPLMLFLKDMAWKHTKYRINNSDPGHTCLIKAPIGEKSENIFCWPHPEKQREWKIGEKLE